VLKATVKGLLARKLRLVTTSLAVLLGVAFIAGTLVLTDTIGRTFDDLFANVNAGVDAHVRAESEVRDAFGEPQRGRVDAALVERVAAVEGAAAAEGFVQGYAQLVDQEGAPVGNPGEGAPTYGLSWPEVDALNPLTIAEGRAPAATGEVVIDRASARSTGYGPGDRARVLTRTGAHDVTVVGVARFGQVDSPGGASLVVFPSEDAQAWVAEPGRFDAIQVVAADGVSEEALRDGVAEVVPAGTEVLTGAEITEEEQSAIREALGFFNAFLLTFALIALFVGSFIIYNTFSILVAQRTREMALLRAIGASRRQVLGSVLVEAAVVGLLASGLGLLAGIGVALGLKALLAAFGIDIPAGGLVVGGRTVVVALVAGLGVTVASAFFPARRAAKVPPLAAMRDVAVDHSSQSGRRVTIGVVVTALGAGLLALGLLGDVGNPAAVVGLGAATVFLGVAVLGPVIARPLSRVIGAPLPRLRGVAGTLARENAMRNPKRTAATAAALMIGVGLVGFITIIASSARASVDDVLDRTFAGDLVVDSGTFGVGGIPSEMAQRIAEVPDVEAVSPLRITGARVEGEDRMVVGVDASAMARIWDLGVEAGTFDDLGAGGVAVSVTEAEERGWSVGDVVTMQFVETGQQELRIDVLYDSPVAGSYVLDLAAYEAQVADRLDSQVYVDLAADADLEAVRERVEAVTADYPAATLLDQTEFRDQQAAGIDQMLNLIYVMLALAVLIALMGIANTLALSIFERTRELGLLRAVGMTRSQLRSVVRWEAVIIALLGTALGLVIGLFFGWALFTALRDQGFERFSAAPGQLAVVVVLAALAGVVAAILPARRAARLDILRAIATE
jgi:putative ABC transport system permease protein